MSVRDLNTPHDLWSTHRWLCFPLCLRFLSGGNVPVLHSRYELMSECYGRSPLQALVLTELETHISPFRTRIWGNFPKYARCR
jgi:hypothetical protein